MTRQCFCTWECVLFLQTGANWNIMARKRVVIKVYLHALQAT